MAQENLQKRYEASMVLSGVGDALGYNHAAWEFSRNGEDIHREVAQRGGLEKLDGKDFPVSDDTVMHLATAEALVQLGLVKTFPDVWRLLAQKYVGCMADMNGRSPGGTCLESTDLLPSAADGWKLPFNPRGGGCGAAMRAMCIGLRFPWPEQEDTLVAVSVESGRLTHHHPTGYLGALASALFTAYAIRGKPIKEWGHHLLNTLDKAREYVKHSNHCVEQNMENWAYFVEKWKHYLEKRGIMDGKSEPCFPQKYGVKERDAFYRSVSFSGWGGSSGHDAPMIAYDGLLWAQDSWSRLADHSIFHGGDNDSTGAIAGAWWGAIYGFTGVPEVNYRLLEYRTRLATLAKQLYELRDKPFP